MWICDKICNAPLTTRALTSHGADGDSLEKEMRERLRYREKLLLRTSGQKPPRSGRSIIGRFSRRVLECSRIFYQKVCPSASFEGYLVHFCTGSSDLVDISLSMGWNRELSENSPGGTLNKCPSQSCPTHAPVPGLCDSSATMRGKMPVFLAAVTPCPHPSVPLQVLSSLYLAKNLMNEWVPSRSYKIC